MSQTPMEGIIDAFYREPPARPGNGARDFEAEETMKHQPIYGGAFGIVLRSYDGQQWEHQGTVGTVTSHGMSQLRTSSRAKGWTHVIFVPYDQLNAEWVKHGPMFASSEPLYYYTKRR